MTSLAASANGLVEQAAPAAFPFGPASVADVLIEGVRDHPGRLALIDGDHTWTYAELDQAVSDVAANVSEPGSNVAFLDVGSSAELIIGVLAIFRSGDIWVADAVEPHIAELAALTSGRGTPVDPHAPAVIASTSGTSGEPKRVVHSQHGVLLPALVSIDVEPPRVDERIGTPLDLRIANVMVLGPLSSFVRGSTFVVMRRRYAEGIAEDIEANAITRLLAVPTLAHDLAHSSDVEPSQLRTLDRVILGGSGGDPETQQRFADRFGIRPTLSYGLSEAPTGVVRESLDDAVGSRAGHPLPHVQIRVVDPDSGEELPTGSVGEVCIRPANSGKWANTWTGTLGYLGRPDLTARLYRGGVLHTGDLGMIDELGRVSITGRLSDLIIRGGANVDPRALEAELVALASVADVFVTGLNDQRLGQRVGAVVVLDSDASTRDFEAELNSTAIALDQWALAEAIPQNSMGKADRPAVLRLLES